LLGSIVRSPGSGPGVSAATRPLRGPSGSKVETPTRYGRWATITIVLTASKPRVSADSRRVLHTRGTASAVKLRNRDVQLDRDTPAHRELVVGRLPAPAVVRLGREEVRLHVPGQLQENRVELASVEPELTDDALEPLEVVSIAVPEKNVVDGMNRGAPRPCEG